MSAGFDLDDFASEPEGGFPATGSVPVGNILARALPIHWDEAVALLQEVIDLATSMRREDVPGFDDVLIDHNGAVTLRGTWRGDRGPVAAGRALHALLGTADVPVALRLFVTQANAPETHASLRAFADGVAYFGKSGRAELIGAIFGRYKAAMGTETPAPVPQQSARTLPPPIVAHTPTPRRSTRTLPRWLAPVAAAVCIASAGSAIWFAFSSGLGAIATTTESRTKETKVASSGKNVPAQPDTKTRTPEPRRAQPSTPASAAGPLRPASAPGYAAASIEASGTSIDLPLPTGTPEPLRTLRPFELDLFKVPAPPVLVTRDRASVRETVATIYSPEDNGVQPPVMLYPQLPPLLMIGAPSEGIVNRMELVVAADGSVERVRLVSAPRRMADMMLLSGAKLWRFTPATKNGEPVRYRTTVSWTVFP